MMSDSAISAASGLGRRRALSFKKLRAEAARCQTALHALGVGVGDFVGVAQRAQNRDCDADHHLVGGA